MYRLLKDRFDYTRGTTVYPFKGHDYGCTRDDTYATGLEHTVVTTKMDGSGPFFTVPTKDLKTL